MKSKLLLMIATVFFALLVTGDPRARDNFHPDTNFQLLAGILEKCAVIEERRSADFFSYAFVDCDGRTFLMTLQKYIVGFRQCGDMTNDQEVDNAQRNLCLTAAQMEELKRAEDKLNKAEELLEE